MTQSARDRYVTDATYKRVVDSMEHLIHASQLTPSEMREAAVLASINYEMKQVRSRMIPLTPELHEHLDAFRRMVENASDLR